MLTLMTLKKGKGNGSIISDERKCIYLNRPCKPIEKFH